MAVIGSPPVSPFLKPEDIVNRAIQNLGARKINTLQDASLQANEAAFTYDKLRLFELRRTPWRFATARAMLRIFTATMERFVPPAWVSTTTYAAGALVQDANGIYWISNYATNLNNQPGVPVAGQPQWWVQYFGPIWADAWANSAAVTYEAGDVVYKTGTTGTVYICTANNTVGTVDPVGTPWVSMGTAMTVKTPFMFQPAGPGLTLTQGGNQQVFGQGRARNLFPLPNGFLRALAPDPKVEGTSTLSTSAALQQLDWQFEGNWLITNSAGPILLRFVADVSDVPSMDPMFCEGLATHIEYALCERVTGSNVKKQAAAAAYQKFIRDARRINWLEIGNTEPEEEEYELTRGPQGVTEGIPATAQQGDQYGGAQPGG